eukprot:3910112-Rhodomonas_salina.1
MAVPLLFTIKTLCLYYYSMVLLTVFLFIGVVNFEAVLEDLFYYLLQLLNESLDLIKALGEMAWEVIQQALLVKKLMEMADLVCELLVLLLTFVKDNVCATIRDIFLELHNALRDVRDVSIFGSRQLLGLIQQELLDFLADIITELQKCVDRELTC